MPELGILHELQQSKLGRCEGCHEQINQDEVKLRNQTTKYLFGDSLSLSFFFFLVTYTQNPCDRRHLGILVLLQPIV